RIEIAKHLEWRAPERALQLRQQLVEGHRRDLRLQLLELDDPARREEIHARRHYLPQLDEGGSELLERHADALRRIELEYVAGLAPLQDAARALEHPGDADPLHEVAEAVPDQDRGDLVQTRQLAHHAEGRAQHRRRGTELRVLLR